jgi:hypothetical protein
MSRHASEDAALQLAAVVLDDAALVEYDRNERGRIELLEPLVVRDHDRRRRLGRLACVADLDPELRALADRLLCDRERGQDQHATRSRPPRRAAPTRAA